MWRRADGCQVNKPEDVMVIDSAEGDHFDAYYASPTSASSSNASSGSDSLLKPYFDGAASWFTYVFVLLLSPLLITPAWLTPQPIARARSHPPHTSRSPRCRQIRTRPLPLGNTRPSFAARRKAQSYCWQRVGR